MSASVRGTEARPAKPVPARDVERANRRTTRSLGRLRTERDIERLERSEYGELVHSRSVYELFQATAALHGNRPALTMLPSGDPGAAPVSYSHAVLLAEITRAANMFAQLGVHGGRVVSILSRTHARVPALMWGAETAGVASCINYLLSPEVIAALLEAEKARVLVCPGPDLDAELWAKARDVAHRARHLEAVLVLGGVPTGADERFHDVDALMATQRADRLVGVRAPDWHDTAALFHTGGTTGLPKLVPLTHLNQIHAAWSFAQHFDLTESDVGLNGFPLFHVGGTSTMGLSILPAGGHVVMLSPAGFRDPGIMRNIWRLVARYRATVLGGVPTAINAMAEVPIDGSDLSSLRFVLTGGATLPKAVAQRFEERTGVPLLEQYGMTESAAALAATPLHGRHVRGSVGLRCPYSRIRVRRHGDSDQWEDCGAGEIGIVTVSGPQIVKGYLDPRHNADAFTADGALITGDLGYLDAEGYLYLTGREKDLIIRSGHNIDPSPIEELANSHPAVSSSAAVGMPDEYAGEIPVIFVALAPGQSASAEEIQEFTHAGIHEPPARPRHVFVLEALPVTGVGKIFKPALRALATKHKLRMLMGALEGPLDIVEISNVDDGGKSFHLKLFASAEIDRDRLEHELRAALSELPIEVAIEWVQSPSER